MLILPILIGIAVLGLVVLGISLVLKARGTLLVGFRYGRRIHFGAAIGVTILVIVLWLFYDLPIVIIPALIIPTWITLFVRKESPPPKVRLMIPLAVGLAVLLAVGVVAFWMMA